MKPKFKILTPREFKGYALAMSKQHCTGRSRDGLYWWHYSEKLGYLLGEAGDKTGERMFERALKLDAVMERNINFTLGIWKHACESSDSPADIMEPFKSFLEIGTLFSSVEWLDLPFFAQSEPAP